MKKTLLALVAASFAFATPATAGLFDGNFSLTDALGGEYVGGASICEIAVDGVTIECNDGTHGGGNPSAPERASEPSKKEHDNCHGHDYGRDYK